MANGQGFAVEQCNLQVVSADPRDGVAFHSLYPNDGIHLPGVLDIQDEPTIISLSQLSPLETAPAIPSRDY